MFSLPELAYEPADLCFVNQLLHRHLTLGGGDLGTMRWQVNLQSRRRTTFAPYSTTDSEDEQKDEAQNWTSDYQHLYVAWLSIIPSAET